MSERLIRTPNGLRPVRGDEPARTFLIAPAGDGEFHAACSSCSWLSFGTYANPRASQLQAMFGYHTCEDS